MFAMIDFVEPICRVKRKGPPPWRRNRITRVRNPNQRAFLGDKNALGCLRYMVAYIVAMPNFLRGVSIANSKSKACYKYAQSTAALRKTVGGVINHQGIRSASSQQKASCLLNFFRGFSGEIKGYRDEHKAMKLPRWEPRTRRSRVNSCGTACNGRVEEGRA